MNAMIGRFMRRAMATSTSVAETVVDLAHKARAAEAEERACIRVRER